MAHVAVPGPPDSESRALQITDGVAHRRHMGRAGGRAELAGCQQVEDADRLRGGEHEVEPAHRPGATRLAQRPTA